MDITATCEDHKDLDDLLPEIVEEGALPSVCGAIGRNPEQKEGRKEGRQMIAVHGM